MVIDLIIQCFQKTAFLIGRPDLPDVFQRFLDTVGYLNSGSLRDLRITCRHLPASEQQQECHRHAPEAGDRKLPVIGKEHDRDYSRRDVGSVEIAKAM